MEKGEERAFDGLRDTADSLRQLGNYLELAPCCLSLVGSLMDGLTRPQKLDLVFGHVLRPGFNKNNVGTINVGTIKVLRAWIS